MADIEKVKRAYADLSSRSNTFWTALNHAHVVLGAALGLEPVPESEQPMVKFYPRYRCPGWDGPDLGVGWMVDEIERRGVNRA